MGEYLTINEALVILNTLRERHKELADLRDTNRNARVYGIRTDKEYVEQPTYDVKQIDKMMAALSKEIRKIDAAIKQANANTKVDHVFDETVLDAIE